MIIVGVNPQYHHVKKMSYIEYSALAFNKEYLEVGSFNSIPKDKPIIVFAEDGEESLEDFDFPDDAYYVFGEDYGKEDMDMSYDVRYVKIPTNRKRFRALFAHQAASIVLWEIFKESNS